jgi:hypothetical protein
MAAPHIAGTMALLRAAHPSWSVEELKALAMNTAGHGIFTGLGQTGDRYGVARVGAGRVDVPAALGNEVVAYDSAGAGAVSVSFGALEVDGTDNVERNVRIVNHGSSAVTFKKGVDLLTDIPGVSITFPGAPTITVAGGGSATFRVRLTANSAQMHNTHDPTVTEISITGAGPLPRHWLSEESGLILLTPQGGGTTLRVPVYANARPVSKMSTADESLAFGGSTSGTIELEGKKVAAGAEPDWNSKVSAFELQATSPQATLAPGVSPLARNADLRFVGASLNEAKTTAYFGISTWGEWATPATDVQFTVQIDLDRNGTVDRQVFNTRFTGFDVFVPAIIVGANAFTVGTFTNVFSAGASTAPFDNDVVVLPVPIGGPNVATTPLPAGTTRFNYRIQGLSRFWGLIDQTDWLTYDATNPGLAFGGGLAGTPMFLDREEQDITVGLNSAAYGANTGDGVLLLHHMNAQGTRAQVVGVTP